MTQDMAARDLGAEERVLLRALAADPRSDWIHGYSAGHVLLTDRRLLFVPFGASGSADGRRWEVALEGVERMAATSVPLWVFGLVRIWVPGIRVVVRTGGGRTLIVGRAPARKWVESFDRIRRARRRTLQRTDSATTD
jgi:hypothetical protein